MGDTTDMLVGRCATVLNLMLTVIRRSNGQTGFVVLPERWIVERRAVISRQFSD
ncbi:hypothetical protein AB0945_36640 [Streptomyces sp. NPDC005474]|uniref:hypothetical protein n=1 Tax=Streptomyces sp. NPDC005474 TaxID=3154878 RepID=UPI0034540419